MFVNILYTTQSYNVQCSWLVKCIRPHCTDNSLFKKTTWELENYLKHLIKNIGTLQSTIRGSSLEPHGFHLVVTVVQEIIFNDEI